MIMMSERVCKRCACGGHLSAGTQGKSERSVGETRAACSQTRDWGDVHVHRPGIGEMFMFTDQGLGRCECSQTRGWGEDVHVHSTGFGGGCECSQTRDWGEVNDHRPGVGTHVNVHRPGIGEM